MFPVAAEPLGWVRATEWRAPAGTGSPPPPPRAAAAEVFVGWGRAATPAGQFAIVLKQELTLDSLIQKAPSVEALRDDRPVNEYYLLRSNLSHAMTHPLSSMATLLRILTR